MKLVDVIQVLAKELGTSDLKEINKILKAEPAVKFRIAGKALGHFGFTGQIKSLTEEGIKVFTANKVSLIRFSDIETFEKAKARVERPVRKPSPEPSSAKGASKKAKAPVLSDDFDDDDDEDFDDEDFEDDEGEDFEKVLPKKNKTRPTGKNGSRFIPTPKK